MNTQDNLFVSIQYNSPDEVCETLAQSAHVRIERLVSHGHASPAGFWYDQDQAEWVAILRGSAVLRFEDHQEPVKMQPGDCVNIAAHRRHRVEWTTPEEPTVWLAVHYA
jgi:cupin 2 domain-containing protein